MKKTILLPILAWTFSLHASAELKVESVKIIGKDARAADTAFIPDIDMPVVLPLTGPAAANINDAMYIELFGTLAPPKVAKKYDVGVLEGMASQEFSVTRNDRILTLEFDTEGCGAYCEGYQQVFAFDAKTGRRITAVDVLTSQGQREVLRLLRKKKIAAYSEQIEINRADLQVQLRKKAGKEVIGDLQERIELNADCLAQAKAPMTEERIRWHRLNPTREALLVTSARCSNHATRALDDVDQVTVKIPYGEIMPHLTPYGRSLFLGEGDGKPTEVFGQVLRGRIGTNSITMLLSNEDGENVHGWYFYNRQRKKLEVNGQRRGRTIELTESIDDGSSNTGKFVLTINGSTIKGAWSDMKGTKQFEVTASAP
jgi:hypothetical protein